MTDSDDPWEPPLAGTEVEQLAGALERLRTTFRWKADDLTATGLQARIGASSLTLGGLLKHLAWAEDYMFTVKLRGEPIGAPWDAMDSDGDDWEFTSAAKDSPEQLYAFWDGAVERSRARLGAALADGGLDQLVHVSWPDGRHASLRRLVCDLIEEYGRHTGHADLLREAVDGLTGEDPPAGWHPKAGQYRYLEESADRTRMAAYLSLIVTDKGQTVTKSAGVYDSEVVLDGGSWRFRSMVLDLDSPF